MRQVIGESILPLLVNLWATSGQASDFLLKAATQVSSWDAKRLAAKAPALAGPSSAKTTHPPPSTARTDPFASPPPDPNALPCIKVDRSTRAAPSNAAMAKAAHIQRSSLPAASKGKGKAKADDMDVDDDEAGRQDKTFQELEEEGSTSEFEVQPKPKRRIVNAPKRKVPPGLKSNATTTRRAVSTGELHDPPCGNCRRSHSECWKEEKGGACVRCIRQKHACTYSRARGGGKKMKTSPVKKRIEVSNRKHLKQ